jgi:hypothetical protein
VECGHLHHHGRTVALTHGELPLHPNYLSAMLRAQRRRETVTEGGWAELPDELLAKVLEMLQVAGRTEPQTGRFGFSEGGAHGGAC